MSYILDGEYVSSSMTKNARGGTELMVNRLVSNVPHENLVDTQIHVSRYNAAAVDEAKRQILWCHDLAEDPAVKHLANNGWERFAVIVFVSWWQRDQYLQRFGIPQSRTAVIHNAIEELKHPLKKSKSGARFIYHTTPHRGLAILVPVFKELCKHFDGLHLDVYSSFEIYGWGQRDIPYQTLFQQIIEDPKMTYHGSQPNDVILKALSKADFFLYPSIWKETSCLAMIEAMSYKCITIHPDLAALTETQQFGPSMMYSYHDDWNIHAERAYSTTYKLLELKKSHPHLINNHMFNKEDIYKVFRLETFTNNWINILDSTKNVK